MTYKIPVTSGLYMQGQNDIKRSPSPLGHMQGESDLQDRRHL